MAHLTEKSELATSESAVQLEQEWGRHWEAGSRFVLEKSPSSLLRMRFLQALFPEAYFVVILRHPVANAYATHAWGEAHGGKGSLGGEAAADFVEHWLAAHAILDADLPLVRRVRIVHLEQLSAEPQATLNAIFDDLGLESCPLPQAKVTVDVNRKYFTAWRKENEALRARMTALAPAFAKYGYSLGTEGFDTIKALPYRPVIAATNGTNGHAVTNGTNGVKRSAAVVAGPVQGVAKAPKLLAPPPATDVPMATADGMVRPLILTFGTRGDVQPFIPLALEMQRRGMAPVLVTHPVFRPLVEGAGIAFASLVTDEKAAPLADARESYFLEGVASFYETHGDSMVEVVTRLLATHSPNCLVIGSLIFFVKWLRTLGLPLIHTRFSPYAAAVGESALQAHAKDVAHFLSIGRSYGLSQAIKAEAALPDQDLLGAIEDMKTELTLLAYDEGCEVNSANDNGNGNGAAHRTLPGLPMLRTGFWLTPAPAAYAPPAALATFLAAAAPPGAPKPICLNFGSMNVYDAPWAAALLGALQATGRPVLAIGQPVPQAVRAWPNTFWLPAAPHAFLFPLCGCVIHHGGAGTTAAAAAAGVPSVVVPFLSWSDQPRFAAWVQRTGCGAHVPPEARTPAGFAAAFETALAPPATAAATALGAALKESSGVQSAVDAIITRVSQPELLAAQTAGAVSQLRALKRVPHLSEGGKLRAGLYILLREPKELPLRTYAARDAWLEALGKQLVETPLYKSDWPPKHKPLDLELHDLPHASSLIEWWYFHAHLTASDGTPFCIFVALFTLKLGGEPLSHIHASLLIGGKRHVYYTAGEPNAPEAVLKHRHPRQEDYFERALREVFRKKRLPMPDALAPARFNVPADAMDFACDRMHMVKTGPGVYRISVTPTDAPAASSGCLSSSLASSSFGFDLTFTGTKPAVRNGIDGVSPGVSSEDAMFYYSITRMDVEGSVTLPRAPPAPPEGSTSSASASGAAADSDALPDGGAFTVRGEGWYDHEFGGDSSRSNSGGGVQMMDVQWAWTGVQLSDGSELAYAKTMDNVGKGTLVDKAVLIDQAGGTSLRSAELAQTATWTSLETFIAYGRSWTLEVPEEELSLQLTAVVDAQELISVISTPAYWEGQVAVTGTRRGHAVSGFGFVEQYFGSQNQNFRTMLQAVSNVVLRNVDMVFPYEPTREHMVQLVVSKEFEPMMEGLPTDVFVEQLVKPVRAITDRQGKGWRSMGAAARVGGRGRRGREARALHVLPRVPAHWEPHHRRHPGQLASATRRAVRARDLRHPDGDQRGHRRLLSWRGHHARPPRPDGSAAAARVRALLHVPARRARGAGGSAPSYALLTHGAAGGGEGCAERSRWRGGVW